MRDINLLPDRILYKKRYFFLGMGKVLCLTVLILGIVGLLLLRPYQRMELQKQVAELNTGLEVPELKELNELENTLSRLKKENSALEAVIKKIPSRKVATEEVLRKITSHMPPGIAATDISYQTETQQINLQLSAAKRDDISLFLRRLHDDPLFADVNVGEINGAENQYKFSLVLTLK